MPASLTPRTLVALTVAFIAAIFIFAGVYTATQHNPTPTKLRVGAVGPEESMIKLEAGLNLGAPGMFKVIRYEDRAALETAIEERKVYGGYIQEAENGRLVTASAAGNAAATALTKVATQLTTAIDMPLETEDLVPAPERDSAGLSTYTFQYGLLVPSFVFAMLIFMFGHGLTLAWRLGLIASYSIGAGIVGALTVDLVVGALTGHFFALAGMGILYALMAVLVSYGLSVMLSFAGAALAGLALILVGNSVGGGSINQEFLPDVFRQLGQAFPNGAFIRAVRDIVYFEGNNAGRAILVVALWAVGGLALTLAASPVKAIFKRTVPAKAQPEPAASK